MSWRELKRVKERNVVFIRGSKVDERKQMSWCGKTRVGYLTNWLTTTLLLCQKLTWRGKDTKAGNRHRGIQTRESM